MTTITFDTLHLVDRLKSAGIPQDQAEAVIRVIAEAQDSLVTKDVLEIALAPLKTDLAVLKSDSITLKWMMGIIIAGVMSLVIKAFVS